MNAMKSMPSQWPKFVVVGWVALLGGHTAVATEEVIADASTTHYPGNEGEGYSGALTLLEVGQQGGVLAALTDTHVPLGSLLVLDLDAYRIQSGMFTFSGGFSIGHADADSTTNTLYKARISVDTSINPNWSVRVADQYVELSAIRGNLVSATGEYHPTPQWGIKAGGGYSVSGTLADRYGELALHWYGPQHVFGGLVAGRSGYDPAMLGLTTVVRQTRQEYVGAGIPWRGMVFNIVADNLTVEGASRQTIHLGVTVPFSL